MMMMNKNQLFLLFDNLLFDNLLPGRLSRLCGCRGRLLCLLQCFLGHHGSFLLSSFPRDWFWLGGRGGLGLLIGIVVSFCLSFSFCFGVLFTFDCFFAFIRLVHLCSLCSITLFLWFLLLCTLVFGLRVLFRLELFWSERCRKGIQTSILHGRVCFMLFLDLLWSWIFLLGLFFYFLLLLLLGLDFDPGISRRFGSFRLDGIGLVGIYRSRIGGSRRRHLRSSLFRDFRLCLNSLYFWLLDLLGGRFWLQRRFPISLLRRLFGFRTLRRFRATISLR
mmetsp:Transcript_9112/g.25908  ORF Transcript_9112/g.25908 Transcript_9112/m.25908 type:complete len:277 (-) Transcript_9112:4197-5027(-)